MSEAPTVLIMVAVLIFIAALISFIGIFSEKSKHKKILLLITGIICLSLPALVWIGDLLKEPRLWLSGIFIPLSVLFLFFFFWQLFTRKTCTLAVQATCTGFTESRGRHGALIIKIPQFTYDLNGESITTTPIASDEKVAIDWRFSKGKIYTIYVNPKDPHICKYDDHIPAPSYWGLVLGILGVLVSIVIAFFTEFN